VCSTAALPAAAARQAPEAAGGPACPQVCRYSPSGNWHGEFTSQVRPFDSARLRMENSRRAQLVPNVVKAG